LRNDLPAHSGHNYPLHVANVQPKARGGRPVHRKIEEITAGTALGKRTAGKGRRALILLKRVLDGDAGFLNGGEVGTKHLDAQGRANTGGEHLGAGLDGHPEDIGHPRKFQLLVHVLDQPVPGHSLPPLVLRFQRDYRLHHGQGRGVGSAGGATHFAEDVLHLGNIGNDPVHGLQGLGCFCDGHARQGRGHKENRPLVEGRHKLVTQLPERYDG